SPSPLRAASNWRLGCTYPLATGRTRRSLWRTALPARGCTTSSRSRELSLRPVSSYSCTITAAGVTVAASRGKTSIRGGQIADWRRAISFLEAHPAVDADRIGLWGTSYAGGHAIVLGATDRRLKAVVAQVPTISGYQQGLRRVPPEALAVLEAAFD